MLVALPGAAVGQDQSKRAATLQRLQAAGENSANAKMCEMAGYKPDDDGRLRYVRGEVESAKAVGIDEDMAYAFASQGLNERTEANATQLLRLAQLIRTGDKSYRDTATRTVDELVGQCDRLSHGGETRSMFTSTPQSADAARAVALKRFRLSK